MTLSLFFMFFYLQVLDALCCHYLYGVDLHQTGIGFKGANISFFTTNSEIIQGRAKVFKLLEFAAEGESTPST